MLKAKEVTKLMTRLFCVPVEECNANAVYQDILNRRLNRREMEQNFDVAFRNIVLGESKASLAREIGVSQTMISQRCARARDASYCRIREIFPENEIVEYFSKNCVRPDIDMFVEFTVIRGLTKFNEVQSVPPNELNQAFREYIVHQRDRFISRECAKFGGPWLSNRWGVMSIMDNSMSGVEAATGISYISFYEDLSIESYIEICGCDTEYAFVKHCENYVETWFPGSGITTASLTNAEFRELFSLNDDDEEVIS